MVLVPGWDRFTWLQAGFTERAGGESTCYGTAGDLNLGYTKEDDPEVVRRNRARLGEALATVSQVHGKAIHAVTQGGPAGEGDGLLTATPGVLLAVMAADCVPVLLVDTKRRAVGAFHAGWRGTRAGIVAAGVAQMVATFGCSPSDMTAAIGPSIGPCCYEVGEEFTEWFSPDLFEGRNLNLWEANRRLLLASGVADVTIIGECTACTMLPGGARKYWSHRADGGSTGRAMGVVGVR